MRPPEFFFPLIKIHELEQVIPARELTMPGREEINDVENDN